MVLVQEKRESNGEGGGAPGKKTQEGGASSGPTNNEERGHLKVAATHAYSKWIRTISGAVQTRRGGPQVPAPLEV